MARGARPEAAAPAAVAATVAAAVANAVVAALAAPPAAAPAPPPRQTVWGVGWRGMKTLEMSPLRQLDWPRRYTATIEIED